MTIDNRLSPTQDEKRPLISKQLSEPVKKNGFLPYANTSAHSSLERFESLDYDTVENELYRAEESKQDHQKHLVRQAVNRWVVCLLIGLCTAIVAAAIDIQVFYYSKMKFHFAINRLASVCEHQNLNNSLCIWLLLPVWSLVNCTFVGIAALLVLYVAPAAMGSGIPQVKCFLNGVQFPGVSRLKTLFVKTIGVASSMAGGLVVGKEGPMIHAGAIIGAGISQGHSPSLSFDLHLFEYFRNDKDMRDFISAGAAAGVSAAFASPIGGVLYSLEEGGSFWNQSLTWRMVFAAMISTFSVNVILSAFHGESNYFSWNGMANFGEFENKFYSLWEIPFFILIGIIGGLLGALFNMLNSRLTTFRKIYIKTERLKLAECLLVTATTTFIGFTTLMFVSDCKPIASNSIPTEMNQLWCSKGEYSVVAELLTQIPEKSVKSLFHSPAESFLPHTLFIFSIEYFLLTLWTNGLSVPSGILIPSLLIGATWGRLFGIGVQYMFPHLDIDPGKYALAGAAAQLGGVVRMTISLMVIVVEATRDITFGLPVMLVLKAAKVVGDLFNEGLYDSHIDLAKAPILGWQPPTLSRNILSQHIMSKDVVTLCHKERVGRIVEILQSTRHHGFPVVDEIRPPTGDMICPDYGHLYGLVVRSQLIVLLKKRHFTLDYDGEQPAPRGESVSLTDFRDRYPRHEPKVSELALSWEDESCWIDLQPFLHPSPHRVSLNASLDSVFRIFRGLGLRFLFVVNEKNRLRGIITRKDIARFKERPMRRNFTHHEVYISNFKN